MVYALFARKATLAEASSAAHQPQTRSLHAGDGSTVNDADGSPSNATIQDDGILISQTESADDALAAAQAVEPSSSTNRDIPIAAENHIAEREHRQAHDPVEGFLTQGAQLGANHTSTPAIAESQVNTPKPRKRRRRGTRLTRVKNERANKAQAKAKANAKSKEDNVEPPVTVNAPLESTEPSVGPFRRLTRAMAREAEHAEGSSTVESTRRSEGKGKAISKDLPSGDATTTGSKRKRCAVDDDAEGAPQEDSGEAGPSSPTRRKLQAPVNEEEPPPPPTHRMRAITRAAAPEALRPARGLKRYRSLAPEPSEGRIDAERKRARLASPERLDDSPSATSSRIRLNHSNASVNIEEPDREASNDDPMDNNVAIEEPVQVQSDLVIVVDGERESTDAGSDPPNHPPAHSFEESQFNGPQCGAPSLLPPHAPDPPPKIDVPERPHYLLVPQLYIPPSPVPPLGMFPPPPPGNHLRRHETTVIGLNVYRPDDPYYFRR